MLDTLVYGDSLTLLIYLVVGLVAVGIFLLILAALGYIGYLWYKYRHREEEAMKSTLLQVAVARDNEIKIDAAEQLFASLASIRKGGRFSFLKPQPHVSFEIVGMPGDIRFYIHVPNKLRDFVEKQINGAYTDAQIVEIDDTAARQRQESVLGSEYNIFSENGKVSFTSLSLKTSNYLPIKVFKELPVDPMASITSTLAKMGQGEGVSIQVLISPAGGKWKKLGRGYIGKTKKTESNPEKATYKTDPKELEAIENKIGKPGFDATIRIVVSSTTKESADAHLGNIVNAFSQYSGSNGFKKNQL